MTRREMFNELEGIRKRIDELEELLGECKDSEEIPKEYNEVEEVITMQLRELGVIGCYQSERYLKEALMIVVNNPTSLHVVCKNIYSRVARINATTPAAAERNIRYAKEKIFSKNSYTKLERIFGNSIKDDVAMPNKQFLKTLADYIRTQCK